MDPKKSMDKLHNLKYNHFVIYATLVPGAVLYAYPLLQPQDVVLHDHVIVCTITDKTKP